MVPDGQPMMVLPLHEPGPVQEPVVDPLVVPPVVLPLVVSPLVVLPPLTPLLSSSATAQPQAGEHAGRQGQDPPSIGHLDAHVRFPSMFVQITCQLP